MAHGVRALVIDAGVRDVAALTSMGFPVWSKTINAQGTVKETPGNVQTPIVCAGASSARATSSSPTTTGSSSFAMEGRRGARRRRSRARTNEADKRDRLAKGELGLDMYQMREKLAERGLRYEERSAEMTAQTAIPCSVIRGGTSKGLYFHARDLPVDVATRDAVLLAAMGSPDAREIDGMGGGHPLTSKVAVVAPSERSRRRRRLPLLAGVARPRGGLRQPELRQPARGRRPLRPRRGPRRRRAATSPSAHLDGRTRRAWRSPACNARGRAWPTTATARIDGVPGSAAPVPIEFLDIAGFHLRKPAADRERRDVVEGVRVTCIDNGMPVVCLRASDVGVSGYEEPAAIEANAAVRAKVEAIRRAAGALMNLGDVAGQTVPKVSLLAPAQHGGAVSTRTFIPQRVHEAIGVFGAVSVATACLLPGIGRPRGGALHGARGRGLARHRASDGLFHGVARTWPSTRGSSRSPRRRCCAPPGCSCVARSSFPLDVGRPMIIDCHGHFTTAPEAHTLWRVAQVAAFNAGEPYPAYPEISDDEIVEAIESNQLRLLRERGAGPHHLLAARVGDGAPRRRRGGEPGLVAGVQRPHRPRGRRPLSRPTFAGVGQLPQSPGAPIERLDSPSWSAVSASSGFVGVNLSPDPSGGRWDSPPLTDRSWYPIYEKLVELDVPAMIHVSSSCNPNFHTTGAHYINADTTAFMQLLQGDLFADFPDLRFVIPHGGGAVPYHWGRYRGLADMLDQPDLSDAPHAERLL